MAGKSWVYARGPQAKTRALFDKIAEIVNGLERYWPVTVRAVYYRLVAALVIKNCLAQYNRISRALTLARVNGYVPWEAIDDQTRTEHLPSKWRGVEPFIEWWTDAFLTGYVRDPLEGQREAIEIWVEKNALARIAKEQAEPYGIPVVAAGGYSSTSFTNHLADRIKANAERHEATRILYFGDFDPSGMNMLPAMVRKLHEAHGVPPDWLTWQRCALNRDQIDRYNLPADPAALKEKDPRAQEFKEVYGHLAVELDALPLDVFEDMVRKAIGERLDRERLERIQVAQEADLRRIAYFKSAVEQLVDQLVSE